MFAFIHLHQLQLHNVYIIISKTSHLNALYSGRNQQTYEQGASRKK